jgi:hypothetical protein
VIIRVENRKRFTILSNVPIEDERLSWEALGVLCWLLSKPDGWEALRAAVSNRKRGAGRDKVARIFAELQAADYMLRKKQQREDGRFEWSSLVFEEPFVSLGGKTVAGSSVNRTGKAATVQTSSVEPATVEPSLENSALSKTQRSKTDRSKTQEAKTQGREEPSRAPRASFVNRRLKPWPEGFELDSELEKIARSAGCDPNAEFAAFKDYCITNVKEYADWYAAFAGWIRKTERFGHSILVSAAGEKEDRWNGCPGGDCQHRCHHKGCADLPDDQCNHAPGPDRGSNLWESASVDRAPATRVWPQVRGGGGVGGDDGNHK